MYIIQRPTSQNCCPGYPSGEPRATFEAKIRRAPSVRYRRPHISRRPSPWREPVRERRDASRRTPSARLATLSARPRESNRFAMENREVRRGTAPRPRPSFARISHVSRDVYIMRWPRTRVYMRGKQRKRRKIGEEETGSMNHGRIERYEKRFALTLIRCRLVPINIVRINILWVGQIV